MTTPMMQPRKTSTGPGHRGGGLLASVATPLQRTALAAKVPQAMLDRLKDGVVSHVDVMQAKELLAQVRSEGASPDRVARVQELATAITRKLSTQGTLQTAKEDAKDGAGTYGLGLGAGTTKVSIAPGFVEKLVHPR
jgi:hypothetical protein